MDSDVVDSLKRTLDSLNEHPIVMYVLVPSLAIAVVSTTFAYILSAIRSGVRSEPLSKDSTIVVENVIAIFLSIFVVLFYLFVQGIEFKYVFFDMLFQIALTSFLLRVEFYRTISSSIKWWIIKKLGYSDSEKDDIRSGHSVNRDHSDIS